MLPFYAFEFIMAVVCIGLDSHTVPEGRGAPTYLPVEYQVLGAQSSFFLKEADQELMRNSSPGVRAEPFLVYQARRTPSVRASYGPLSVELPVPQELLVAPSSALAFSRGVRALVVSDRVHPGQPRVQALFYMAGRDWDDYSSMEGLPCVETLAFHETQEVRAACRLQGPLGLCVAELEPPSSWFQPSSVVPGRQRAPGQATGTPVELYYVVRPPESGVCGWEDAGRGSPTRAGGAAMQRIGSIRLQQGPVTLDPAELWLDHNFAVLVPPGPIYGREIITAFIIATAGPLTMETFTLRVRLKEGVAFQEARPSNPEQWAVSPAMRNAGEREVTLHCRRKEPGLRQRAKAGSQTVLQIDLEVDAALGPRGDRSVSWQVEYPGTRARSDEVQTQIYLAHGELGGIVALAMETEILNTAVLTGRTVAVPVKVVSVATDGTLDDVTELVECRSTDEDVVKVSDRCDYVYVNGKETRGRVKIQVNFTYSYLSAQLELTVWIPQLPLQIQVSDSELSQIKGWRVPVIAGGNHRLSGSSEDEEDGDRRKPACTLQYQHAMVRVLAAFVAQGADRRSPPDFLLGSGDWQVDVTELVRERLMVENPRVARLQDAGTLVGLDTGKTTIQVLSPLSDSVLAEKTVKVLDDKVTITELGVQLVAGLSLSLQLSPGSNRAIVATATAQEVLNTPKQESQISAWLLFSDGSLTPLDLYNPDHFVLTAVSLDEAVVRVQQGSAWKWPVIITEGDGQGPLVRVEMAVCEPCQKSKSRGVLAAGNGGVRVKLSQRDKSAAEELTNNSNGPYYSSPVSDPEPGAVGRGSTTTTRTAIAQRPGGHKLAGDSGQVQSIPIDFTDFPAQADLPVSRNVEDDLVQAARGLTDLEIGMYALLGVFCLAILVFLINCVSYALKYSHKQLPGAGQEHAAHAHDWVWLGNEAELLETPCGLSPKQDEPSARLNAAPGHLLNGASSQKNVQGQIHRSSETAGVRKDHRNEPLNSPTSKRKRVKFTTFTAVPPDLGSLSPGLSQDIQWVCRGVELEDSKELRNYIERLNGSVLKNTA